MNKITRVVLFILATYLAAFLVDTVSGYPANWFTLSSVIILLLGYIGLVYWVANYET